MYKALGRAFFILAGVSLLGEIALSLFLTSFSLDGDFSGQQIQEPSVLQAHSLIQDELPQKLDSFLEHLASESETEEDLADDAICLTIMEDGYILPELPEHPSEKPLVSGPRTNGRPLYLQYCELKIPFV